MESKKYLAAFLLLACVGCGEESEGVRPSEAQGSASYGLEEEPPPSAPQPPEEPPALTEEQAAVLEKSLQAFVEVYGDLYLVNPEKAPPLEDYSELERRLAAELTDEERTVLERYAQDPKLSGIGGGARLLALPSPATLYGVGDGRGDGSSDFYRITVIANVLTIRIFGFTLNIPYAAVSSFVKIGETGRILTDLAYDFNGGREIFYAVDAGSRLYRLNGSTGATTLVGSTGRSGLNALDLCRHRLYSWGGLPLVTLNTSSGASTWVGSTGFTSSGDLACEPWPSNWLFGTAVGSTTDRLVRIDMATGAATLVSSLSRLRMYGLAFGQNGYLYAAAHMTSAINVSIISRTTGATLFPGISYTTNSGLYGLAARFIPY